MANRFLNEAHTEAEVEGWTINNSHPFWVEYDVDNREDMEAYTPRITPELAAHQWAVEELMRADVQINFHMDGDKRATLTELAWRAYRKGLRNYTSVLQDGTIMIVGEKPII